LKLKYFIFLCFLSVLTYFVGADADDALVPLNHPVYAYLERQWAYGRLNYLPQARPYTVARVKQFLDYIDPRLPDDDRTELNQMRSAIVTLERRDVYLAGEEGYLQLNVPTSFQLNYLLNSPENFELTGTQNVYMDFSVPSLSFNVDFDLVARLMHWNSSPYYKFEQPQRADYSVYTHNFTTGAAAFNHEEVHVPGDLEAMYLSNFTTSLSTNMAFGSLAVGRGALDWGPSGFSNLLLSGKAKPYEYVSLQVPLFGRGTFSWVTGFLKDFVGFHNITDSGKKMMNSHRVELQVLPWLTVSLFETILYSNRFELAYLLPLSVYYVSEMMLGEFDNKLGGMDFVFRLPNTKLYLVLYADDWDFGQIAYPMYYNNEWGGQLGLVHYGLLPSLRLTAEYTYLSQWMYTHMHISADPAHWHNSYQHYDSHLGNILDPNSHMLYLNAAYSTSVADFGFDAWFTQNSRMDINSVPDFAYERELYGVETNKELFYTFLDWDRPGIVIESNFAARVTADFKAHAAITLHAALGLEAYWNKDKQAGNDMLTPLLELRATIDL